MALKKSRHCIQSAWIFPVLNPGITLPNGRVKHNQDCINWMYSSTSQICIINKIIKVIKYNKKAEDKYIQLIRLKD